MPNITGKVARITTTNGTTEVQVQTEDGNTIKVFVRDPGNANNNDMTEQELNEFKRAQNHDLGVSVDYDERDGNPSDVTTLAVISAMDDEDDGQMARRASEAFLRRRIEILQRECAELQESSGRSVKQASKKKVTKRSRR